MYILHVYVYCTLVEAAHLCRQSDAVSPKYMYMYSAVHEVACKPIFVFNVIFMDILIGTCYWCMLYAKMITKDY